MLWVGVALIVVGGLAVLAGELLGVYSKRNNDTITEWVAWLRDKTHGAALLLVLAAFGVLGWHFAVS